MFDFIIPSSEWPLAELLSPENPGLRVVKRSPLDTRMSAVTQSQKSVLLRGKRQSAPHVNALSIQQTCIRVSTVLLLFESAQKYRFILVWNLDIINDCFIYFILFYCLTILIAQSTKLLSLFFHSILSHQSLSQHLHVQQEKCLIQGQAILIILSPQLKYMCVFIT